MRTVKKWGRSRPLMFLSTVFCTLLVVAVVEALFAQEKKAPEATPPAAAAPAPAPAAAAPADAATLPPYFTPDPSAKGSPWPDPTGGAAGYWTTPSPSPSEAPVGDGDPNGLS